MLRIIFVILIVYIIYRFVVRFAVQKISDNYLKKQRDRFYEENPHFSKPKPEEKPNRNPGFSLRKTDRRKRHSLITEK